MVDVPLSIGVLHSHAAPENARPLTVEESQRIALEILDEFDAFCTSRGIPYYVIAGSLIGALRSRDLLPWDDDIDVALKREDYERFCREYADSDKFMLYRYNRVENYRHGMAKLVRRGTLFVEPTSRDTPYGVFVDVFPLDAAPSIDDRAVARLYRWVKIYNYAFVINAQATRASKVKDAIRRMLRVSLGLLPYRWFISRLERKMAAGRGDTLVNYWGAWAMKEYASAESFASATTVTIRGKQYPAPVGCDEWLTNVYGDYMSPPSGPTHYHGRAYLVQEDGSTALPAEGS